MVPNGAFTLADVPTLRQLIREAERALVRAGVLSPGADALSLAGHAFGLSRVDVRTRASSRPGVAAVARFRDLTARRAAREPLQLLVGTSAFVDLDLNVRRGVFIPRPETEGLAVTAAALIGGVPRPRILDLCAGAGPLALYLARTVPGARVTAVEKDARACDLIRSNAEKVGVDVEVITADVLDAGVAARFPEVDLVVANPPYVPTGAIAALPPEVRDWDPRAALDGGLRGLAFYGPIAAIAAARLIPGGWIAVEVGDDIASEVVATFSSFLDVTTRRDLAGRERYVAARK